jgi:transposase-like protein
LESTREAVARLVEAGRSRPEIARELGVSKATLAYHFRKLGVAPDERFARRYDWEAIQRAYDSGLSMRQCAARFGFSNAAWHKAVQRGELSPRPTAMPIEDLLVADRRQTGRNHLEAPVDSRRVEGGSL